MSAPLDPADCGCSDYALSRRSVLRGAAVAGAAGVATSLIGDVTTSSVFGAEPGGNVLVVLSQRGGADGMSLVVPHGEPAYYAARPTIAIAKSELLHADQVFGLHPAFAPLSPMWTSGRLAALHAVGLPAPNRSHFAAMEEIEDAAPGSALRLGWLNRVVGALGDEAGIFEGVQLGSNVIPTSLVGPAPTLALANSTALTTPYADTEYGPALRAGLSEMYAAGVGPAHEAGRRALELDANGKVFSAEAAKGAAHGAAYPASALGQALRESAALIRSGLGVRAITVDSGGWDHHNNLRALLTSRVSDLASAVAAFFTDLGADGDRVTLVTLSEFGRRLDENGAAGLDHGYGNAVLVAGAGVRGGRYHSRWPTLATGKQVEGDLAVTTDYRLVLAEILRARFPSIDASEVFPGVGHLHLGFMR